MKRALSAGRQARLLAGTALAAGLILNSGAALALPLGPAVAGSSHPGSATFDFSIAKTLNVNQTARRVVIDWSSFDISSGETVNFNQGAADWVAFNRIAGSATTAGGPTTINGSLNATGGVWLFTQGGLLIGSDARINVGSFVGATGQVDPTNLNQLLLPDPHLPGFYTVAIPSSPGQGVETLTVQPGAQINAAKGFVALQAETMVQGGTITAADGVAYEVAQTGSITFTGNAGGQQIHAVSATPVSGQDRPSFSHTGSTSAGWVGLDAPSASVDPSYHGMINLDGVIQATGIKPGSGNGGVVLMAGSDLGPAQTGYNGATLGLDASGAAITSTHSLVVRTDSLLLGAATLGASLDLSAYGDISLAGPATTTSFALIKSKGPSGALTFGGDLSAGGRITASAQTISVAPGVTIQADSSGHHANDLQLTSNADFSADATSLLLAGPSASTPTSNVRVSAGQVSGSGNLIAGAMSGVDSRLIAYGLAGQGGDITVGARIYGSKSVVIRGNPGNSVSSPGVVHINADMVSDGLIDLLQQGGGDFFINGNLTAQAAVTVNAKNVMIGPGVVVESDSAGQGAGDLHISGRFNLIADATSQLVGGPDPTSPTASVLISAGRGGSGGFLQSGAVSGQDVTIYSYSAPHLISDLTIGGLVEGSHSVVIQGVSSDVGQDLDVNRTLADVTSAGPIDIRGQGSGTLTVGSGASVAGLGDVLLQSNQTLTINGQVSGQGLTLTAQDVSIGPGAVVRSDVNGLGTGDLQFSAAGGITADATSLIVAGVDPNAPTSKVSITAGQTGAGANLSTGAVSGTDVTLAAFGSAGVGGNITTNGKIYGANSISIQGNPGDTGHAPGDIQILGPMNSGGSIDLLQSGSGDVYFGGVVTAVHGVTVAAPTIHLGPGAVISSDSGGQGAGDVHLAALGDFTADPTSDLIGGPGPNSPTAGVFVSSGGGGSGAVLTSGGVHGLDVTLYAYGSPQQASSLVIAGPVYAGRSFLAQGAASNAGSGAVDLRVSGGVTSGGSIDIRSLGSGGLTIASGGSLSGAGNVYLETAGDLVVSGQASGGALAAVSQQTLSVTQGGSLATTGTSPAPTWPVIPQNLIMPSGASPQTPTLSGLTLAATGINIQGSVTAGTGASRDDIFIQPLGSTTQLTIGGASGAGGVQLSDALFSHLTGRNVIVLGGPGEGQGPGMDITVQDLSLDPARISALWIGAHSDRTVTVSGAVSGTGVSVNLGFVRPLGGSSGADGYIPGEIDVSGSLGSSGSPLQLVGLVARNDILMGSSGFISAARADPAFNAVASSRSSPSPGVGHLFVDAGALQLAAQVAPKAQALMR